MYWKKEWTPPTVAGVIAFGVGTAVGYAISKYQDKINRELNETMGEVLSDINQLRFEFEDRSVHVHEATRHAWNIVAALEDKTVDKVQEVADSVWDSLKASPNHPSVIGLPERDSVFPDVEEDNWNYDEELKIRTPDVPYIIHRDEYFDEEHGWTQTTLTYYAGDNVLTDEHDTPLYNPERIVGTLEFGKGSQDPSIVYIRNEKLEAEYEVLLDHGLFQVEVLGEEIEHKFDRKEPLQRFRTD